MERDKTAVEQIEDQCQRAATVIELLRGDLLDNHSDDKHVDWRRVYLRAHEVCEKLDRVMSIAVWNLRPNDEH